MMKANEEQHYIIAQSRLARMCKKDLIEAIKHNHQFYISQMTSLRQEVSDAYDTIRPLQKEVDSLHNKLQAERIRYALLEGELKGTKAALEMLCGIKES